MSLEIVIGVIGFVVTILVIAGMILLTPRGAVTSRSIAAAHRRPAEDGRPSTAEATAAGGPDRSRVRS